MEGGFVLFCFVWLATLGVPVVAPGTAAGPFRRVVEAPYWVPSSPGFPTVSWRCRVLAQGLRPASYYYKVY